MNRIFGALFLGLLLIGAVPARAQEEIILEPVIFTAERIPLPESEVAGSAAVITEEEIRSSGAQSLGELLQDYAGITFQQSGSLGKLSDVRVRGSGTAQLLFMMDGFRINDPSGGGFNLTGLSLDNIERIEVVRGGVSSLYGSEGMNGVIHIITKKPDGKKKVHVKETFGSFSTSDSTLTFEGAAGAGGYRLFLDNTSTGGLRENDVFKRRTWGAGQTFGKGKSRLSLNLQGVEVRNGLSVGWGGTPDTDDVQNDHVFFGSASWERTGGGGDGATVRVYRRSITNSYFAPEPFWTTYALTRSRAEGVDAQFNRRFGRVDAVYGFQHERFRGYTEFPDWLTLAPISVAEDWRTTAFFVNTVTSLPRGWRLTAGARRDDHLVFGAEVTPKFTLSKSFHTGVDAYVSTGKNFRAPTFVDLYYPNYGNPALSPERSTYREAGLKYEMNPDSRIGVSWFGYRYSGLITAVLADPVTWRYEPRNVNGARITGFEIDTSFRPGVNAGYALNYTHIDSRSDTAWNQLNMFINADEYEINRAPSDQYAARVTWEGAGPWSWTLRGRLVSSIYDTAVGEGLDGYFTADGKLVFTRARGESYFVEANNLFDEDYEMVADYPAPGLAVRFGIERDF